MEKEIRYWNNEIPYYQDGDRYFDARDDREIVNFMCFSSRDENEKRKAYADYYSGPKEKKAETKQTFTVYRNAGKGTFVSHEETVKEFVLTEILLLGIKAVFFIITLPLSLTLWAIREDKKKQGGFN